MLPFKAFLALPAIIQCQAFQPSSLPASQRIVPKGISAKTKPKRTSPTTQPYSLTTTSLPALNFNFNPKSPSSSSSSSLSPLPKGISPFQKSLSKNLDIQADFRQKAKKAIDAAIANNSNNANNANNAKLMEIEFPPLLGGDKSKSQFDDFDNIQELDRNVDWTVQFAPLFTGVAEFQKGRTWLIFPDLKECELAKREWTGQRYREGTFTTIEAVVNFLGSRGVASSAGSASSNSGGAAGDEGDEGSYEAPWGSSLISGLSTLLGGNDGDAGLLGDKSTLDPLVPDVNSPAKLWLLVQPGNGGPVEDWVNIEKMHNMEPSVDLVIVNGALDKVRGGFYPAIFFPKLAATVDRFYNKFESVFYLKPVSDKGVYGWVYRVYPEPWQVVWEKVTRKTGKDGTESVEVENVVVEVLEERPSYQEVVSMLVKASQRGV